MQKSKKIFSAKLCGYADNVILSCSVFAHLLLFLRNSVKSQKHIFGTQVVATEAAQSYKAEIVKILKSNTIDEVRKSTC